MIDFDNREEIRRIDTQNVLGSIEALPDQCLHAWKDARQVRIPKSYQDIQNIVLCGMGGSGLGARIIETVFFDELKFPITRVNNYNLPAFVGKKTLVICSSYSGSTEETLTNAKQAIDKHSKWMAIGAGGPLIDFANAHGVPYYRINPKFNPSGQPRMAIGYSVVGQLVLAASTGIINFSKKDIDHLVTTMRDVLAKVKVEIDEANNQAKRLARLMKGKIIFYMASGHLVGALHTLNNQLNENVKAFSADYEIPELNHHLMEGLKHPPSNPKTIFAFFAYSSLYPQKITKRFEITRDVVTKNKIGSFVYRTTAETKLSQAFELIQFGAYVNLYLSMLYNQNPAPIPWVDYFKGKLKKASS